ncbi:flagellar basal body rod protein FlgF [Isoalcanivorax pacificus W11-5]|uniref:Flagellar basal-body rod protein FlgF n=1 Tax=Isoalcanivorax pacificus W11-5 TaxID=391936 RepID=A0A0B4XSS8_9GAMM|nr:flagellar basal body rod protein FlgF [Isoalcanivorax pacificus]AJD49372.1 flagellar basal body rod protein FlgF [Isoalcanivorax pacificus W11-5]
MDRILYTAMSGARQSMEQQSVISHNLANATTSGFRAQLHALRAVPVQGDGLLPTRVSVMATTPGSDFSTGAVNATGRDLDVALQGDAWLAVQGADGAEAYTRRGDLQIDGDGLLRSAGRPVIGDAGPVVIPPGAQVFMGADGTLSVLGPGEDPGAVVEAGRMKLVNAGAVTLVRGDDGLFRPAADADGNVAVLPADDNARLLSGALEGSNVSTVATMVDMIGSARRYEMQMKVLQSADDNAQRANSLLSLQG